MRRRSIFSLLTLALALLVTWGGAQVYGQNSPGGSFLTNFNYVLSGQWTWRALTPWIIEGAVDDAFETSVTFTEPTADRTITFQNATHTVVGRDTTDTLTNKTLTSPTISSPTISSETVTGATLQGAVKLGRTAITSAYTVLSTDYYIEATTWTGPLTINLPASITALGTGFIVYIKDGAGLAVGSPSGRTITVNPSIPDNGGSIDGASSQTISTAFGVLKLIVGVDRTGNFNWLKLQ